MNDFEKMGKGLMGSMDEKKINSLANSEDSKRLSQLFDAGEAEKAAKSGDMSALRDILSKVMSTEEGKRLAQQVSGMLDNKGKK